MRAGTRHLRHGFLVAVASMMMMACGSGGSQKAATAPTGHPDVVSLLPPEVRDKGSLTAVMSADYPPDHFTENGTLTGLDPDLSRELGRVMGLRFELVGTNFEAIIPGLQANRYDLAVSTVFVTAERQKVVDFITYFNSGSSLVIKSGGSVVVAAVSDLCGRKVAVEKGTAQAADMERQGAECTGSGRPALTVQTYAKQSDANLALLSGQAEVMALNSTAAGYAAKQNSEFQLVMQYATHPAGIIVPKGNDGLVKAVQAALKQLIADGTYQRILQKWGIEAGAVTEPLVNPQV